MTSHAAASQPELAQIRPWDRSWWWSTPRHVLTLPWFILIHVTAIAGLILFPLPGWRIAAVSFGLLFLGGLGTTVCFHRAMAHKSVTLSPWAMGLLTFFAMLNGSGTPVTWVSAHRLHHAYADTEEDISSPVFHGFWWAHLRWLWQTERPPLSRFAPDLDRPIYNFWRVMLGPIMAVSYFCGLPFGLAAFFWVGSIRLVFALHAQCFINSICHTQPGITPGQDSSRNVGWLTPIHLLQGENWHRNHHARPGLARLGWNWKQPDLGYVTICLLEKIGAARDVRHLTPDARRAA